MPLPAHDADHDANGHERADQVAFEDLWQHRAALRDICQRIVGDAATADDVVQETYVRALRNLDRLEQRPSLMPWLATVARRRSIDELRRRQYQKPVEAMPDESTKPELDPGEAAGVNETVAKVREALTALTDRERELLMHQVNQGLSLAELAAIDESSVASVRSVLSRARSKLREALEEAGARALAPLGVLVHGVKRRLGAVNTRMHQVSPVMPGGYERIGEAVTATAAVAALAIGGLLPTASGPGTNVAATPNAIEATLASSSETAALNAGGAAAALSLDEGQIAVGRRGHTAGAGDAGSATAAAPSQGEHRSDGLIVGGNAPSAPAAPSAPNPLAEPDPQSPEETHVESIDHSQSSDGGPGTLFAVGSSPCATGDCRVVWSSDDAGASWQRHDADNLEGGTVMVPPRFGNGDRRIFAVGAESLQYSLDRGDTWETVMGPTVPGSAAINPNFGPGGDQRIFLGGAPTWAFHANTGVSTPVAVSGLFGNHANFAFDPNFANSGSVFAATIDTAGRYVIARCTDTCPASAMTVLQHDDLEYVPDLAVSSDFLDDATVVAWSKTLLWVSRDAGATFTSVSLPRMGVIETVTDDGAGNFFVAAASRQGGTNALYRTSDFTAFTALGAGTPLSSGVAALTVVSPDLMVAAPNADDGGLYCSTNGGASWSRRCA